MTTMNELFTRYEKECIPDLQKRSQKDYLAILQILRQSFGHLEPREVTPRMVVNFLEVPTGRIHRNRMVTILSTIFKKAQGRWLIEDDLRNPCVGVERWPTRPRDRYVTDEEFKGFRAICSPQVQVAMDLAVIMGQRQGDIVGLKWNQVKTEGIPRNEWYVEINQGKTGKKLGIVITPALEAVLDRAWMMLPHWPREYVLRTNPPRGNPLKRGHRYTEDGFRAMWQRYMREWAKAGNERFHYHDLRAKAGSDSKDVQHAFALLGHQDIKMTARVYERGRRMVMPSQ